MFSTLKFQSANPTIDHDFNNYSFSRHHGCSLHRLPLYLRPPLRFRRLSAQSEYAASSEPSVSSHYTTSVGSSSSSSLQLSQWNLTHRHILVLNVIACAAAVSATWLFFSAIPTLLALKRAAESLEKLMDVTREELPETMAAVRLSGMEISDLTMELSDLGQEITQGVRSSTKAVRIAEERLRQLTNMNPSVSPQEVVSQRIGPTSPQLARTARDIREGIVQGRAILRMFFTLTQFSRMALNYFANRAKK